MWQKAPCFIHALLCWIKWKKGLTKGGKRGRLSKSFWGRGGRPGNSKFIFFCKKCLTKAKRCGRVIKLLQSDMKVLARRQGVTKNKRNFKKRTWQSQKDVIYLSSCLRKTADKKSKWCLKSKQWESGNTKVRRVQYYDEIAQGITLSIPTGLKDESLYEQRR